MLSPEVTAHLLKRKFAKVLDIITSIEYNNIKASEFWLAAVFLAAQNWELYKTGALPCELGTKKLCIFAQLFKFLGEKHYGRIKFIFDRLKIHQRFS